MSFLNTAFKGCGHILLSRCHARRYTGQTCRNNIRLPNALSLFARIATLYMLGPVIRNISVVPHGAIQHPNQCHSRHVGS